VHRSKNKTSVRNKDTFSITSAKKKAVPAIVAVSGAVLEGRCLPKGSIPILLGTGRGSVKGLRFAAGAGLWRVPVANLRDNRGYHRSIPRRGGFAMRWGGAAGRPADSDSEQSKLREAKLNSQS